MQAANAFTCSVSLKCLLTALYILSTVSNDMYVVQHSSSCSQYPYKAKKDVKCYACIIKIN